MEVERVVRTGVRTHAPGQLLDHRRYYAAHGNGFRGVQSRVSQAIGTGNRTARECCDRDDEHARRSVRVEHVFRMLQKIAFLERRVAKRAGNAFVERKQYGYSGQDRSGPHTDQAVAYGGNGKLVRIENVLSAILESIRGVLSRRRQWCKDDQYSSKRRAKDHEEYYGERSKQRSNRRWRG